MPNLITHKIFAEEIRAALTGKAKETADKYPDAFDLGALGGDFLYALRELGFKCKRFANKLHSHGVLKYFSKCAEYLKEKPDEIVLSYVLGMLCHYSLDSVSHAYVNFFVERVFPSYYPLELQYNLHGLMESGIDEHFCREKRKTEGRLYPAGIIAKASRKEKYAIGRLYSEKIAPIYGEEVTPKKCSLSFSITRLFMYFSADKSGKKKAKMTAFENAIGMSHSLSTLMRPPIGFGKVDFMNNERRRWRVVRNEEKTCDETYYEVYERGKEKCLSYIAYFLDCLDGKAELLPEKFSINYEGVRTSD